MVPQPAPAQRPGDPRHNNLRSRRFHDSLRQLQLLCNRLAEEHDREVNDVRVLCGLPQQESLAYDRDSRLPPSLGVCVGADPHGELAIPDLSSRPDMAAEPRMQLSAAENEQELFAGVEDPGTPEKKHISAILRQSTQALNEANGGNNSAGASTRVSMLNPSAPGSTFVALAQTLVIHPSSRWCTIWDVIGGLLISYDVVMIPMEYFPMPRDGFIAWMAMTVLVYWTIDVVVRFFFGYFDEGVVETTLSKVAKNYLKGWFAPDFVVVLMDWIFFGIGEDAQATRSWRISRAARALRLLRLFRLIRLVKFWRMMAHAMDCIQSQVWLLATKGAYLSVTVFLSAHYLACYWYAVGTWEPFPAISWVQVEELGAADAGTLYVYSMHWCMAQSGFGDVRTRSTNILEHVYSIIAQVSWIALISGVFCCCTNWMMEVREASRDFTTQETKLRKFLLRHNSSAQLASHVVRFFRVYHRRRDHVVNESEVRVLPSLPLLLGIRLHREMYLPYLKVHPAFDRFAQTNKIGILSVCHLAMSEVFVDTGQEVFTEADRADHMLTVASGKLEYYLAQCKEPRKVSPGDWLSEACLWLPSWWHLGSLVSSTSSELVALNAEKLRVVISECEQTGWSDLAIRSYGQLFAELADNGEITSDLCEDIPGVYNIAKEAFLKEGRRMDDAGITKSSGFMALIARGLEVKKLREATIDFSRQFTVTTLGSSHSRQTS